MKCLIPNIGSTSFKYRMLDMPAETVLAEGRIERIGQPGGDCPDYPSAIHKCIAAVTGPGKALRSLAEVEAVGFKVVHPGPMAGPYLVDDALFAAMDDFAFFAPAHNPPYIAAMRAFQQQLPGVPLVAVFETTPYASLDEAATTYAVPYEWRTEFGIRRYGFHGASHRVGEPECAGAAGAEGPAPYFMPPGRKFEPGCVPQRRGDRYELWDFAAVWIAAE